MKTFLIDLKKCTKRKTVAVSFITYSSDQIQSQFHLDFFENG